MSETVEFGIVCALLTEFKAVFALLVDREEARVEEGSNVAVTLGTFAGHRVVCACLTKYGESRAATLANALVSGWNPSTILMVGIAAGCPAPSGTPHDIQLGDVVVPCQHDAWHPIAMGEQVQDIAAIRLRDKDRIFHAPSERLVSIQQSIAMEMEVRSSREKINTVLSKLMKTVDDELAGVDGINQYCRPESDLLFPTAVPHTGGEDCTACGDSGARSAVLRDIPKVRSAELAPACSVALSHSRLCSFNMRSVYSYHTLVS
jgi:nucleoside phosphorylase